MGGTHFSVPVGVTGMKIRHPFATVGRSRYVHTPKNLDDFYGCDPVHEGRSPVKCPGFWEYPYPDLHDVLNIVNKVIRVIYLH